MIFSKGCLYSIVFLRSLMAKTLVPVAFLRSFSWKKNMVFRIDVPSFFLKDVLCF